MVGGASRWTPAGTGDAPREGCVMSRHSVPPSGDHRRPAGWDLPWPRLEEGDLPAYAGPVTWCRRPYIPGPAELRARRPDVAIIGVPFDDAVSHRPGARFGPRAIREATSTSGQHSVALGVEPFGVLDVVDTGDVDIIPAWRDRGHAVTHQRVLEVMDSGAVPVILGGDHSLTWPVLSAVVRSLDPRKVAMIHFDAHADTADDEHGVRAGHGTPMRRLIESGDLDGHSLVQVGLRGYWPPPDVFAWMRGQGVRWHPMTEIEERGIDAVMEDAIAEATERTESVYLSVDIDVVDPGVAPGTGTPEPGGLLARELLRAVRRVATTVPLAGMDVMEVSPPYDHAEVTASLAHRCVLEVVSGMAARRLAAADGSAAEHPAAGHPDPARDTGPLATSRA
jgi:agmatinase